MTYYCTIIEYIMLYLHDDMDAGYYHDDMDVLHDDTMILTDKPNNAEDKQRRSHAVLFTFCIEKLRTTTKKKCFYHLRGILPNWILYHLVEYIFPFLMSPYLPLNSWWLMR